MKNICHNLDLCSKALYVMSSFIQQSAEIHFFATWHQLSKIFFFFVFVFVFFVIVILSIRVSSGDEEYSVSPNITAASPLFVHERIVELLLLVWNLSKHGPAPSPPGPDGGSHGCVGCSSDSEESLVLFRHGVLVVFVFVVQFVHGSKKLDCKPSFDGARFCCGYLMILVVGHGGCVCVCIYIYIYMCVCVCDENLGFWLWDFLEMDI
ncbi:hypothetical protein MIMGU_mgv1a013888mg [Erythranthe guttata]|uniref:Uncharacterized protein n=1 Tax=Erythranthe guttata TaxID=4155 RepID=A0A022S468_ERYGU|nr:hypothetical protein MIMGU_mgv1a013888mg [Erythranthe guttata]